MDFDCITLISNFGRCFELTKNERVLIFDATESCYGDVGVAVAIDANATNEKFLIKLNINGKECVVGSWSIQPESSGFGNMFVQTILDYKCELHELRVTDTLTIMSKGHLFNLYKKMFNQSTTLYKEIMKRGHVKVFIEEIKGLVTIGGQNALFATVRMKYESKEKYDIPINACYLFETGVKLSDDVVMVQKDGFSEDLLNIGSKFTDTAVIKTHTNHGGSKFVKNRGAHAFMDSTAPLPATSKDPESIWEPDDVNWDDKFNQNKLYITISSRIPGVSNFKVKQGSNVILATGKNRYKLFQIRNVDIRWKTQKHFPIEAKQMLKESDYSIIDSGYLLPHLSKIPVIIDDCWGNKRTIKPGDVVLFHFKTPNFREFSKYLVTKIKNFPPEGVLGVLDSDVIWGETAHRSGGVFTAVMNIFHEMYQIEQKQPPQHRVKLPLDMGYLFQQGENNKNADIAMVNYFTKWIDEEPNRLIPILTISGGIPQGDGAVGGDISTDETSGL